MKLILGGHWDNAPAGWTALSEQDQDLTAPLKFDNDSVEIIFTEHVIEHLEMWDAIIFFRDAFRVLKPGGVLRTVCPFIDVLTSEFHDKEMMRKYYQTQTRHYYPNADAALKELGIDFLDHGYEFMFDSLLKKHNHRHVWSTDLMKRVLEAIGFSHVYSNTPGESHIGSVWHNLAIGDEACLERRLRGIDPKDVPEGTEFDCESSAIEAMKPN